MNVAQIEKQKEYGTCDRLACYASASVYLLLNNSVDLTGGQMSSIFVFGSNLAGRHGKGAALAARQIHGAVYGVGVGRTGNAYAIPTKAADLSVLPLEAIAGYVRDFVAYAQENPDLTFEVTRVGCGLAGYADTQIAPLFRDAPPNCNLPFAWRAIAETNRLSGCQREARP